MLVRRAENSLRSNNQIELAVERSAAIVELIIAHIPVSLKCLV